MALDTLFFDLKINDLTDKQIESIKKKLSNLGVEMDISSLKKQLDSLSSKTNKVKIEADTKEAENSVKGLKKQLEGMSVPSIKIDNRDNNTIKLIKENLEVAWQKAIYLENELKSFLRINTKVKTIYNFLDIEKIEKYEKEKRIIHI